jgi:hypothetical protein
MQKFYCDVCGSEKDSDDLGPIYVLVDSYVNRDTYDIGEEVCDSCRDAIKQRIEGEIAAIKGGL